MGAETAGAGTVPQVPDGNPPDLPETLLRLRSLALQHAVSTLVIREPATLTWLLGARVHVPQTLDTACLDVVVEAADSSPRLRIVTNAIEAPRLRDTELAGVDADWSVVPWWGDRSRELPTGAAVGTDRPLPGATDVGPALARARRVLTAHQQQVLRAVCRDTAAAATAAADRITPATTEYAAAGVLAQELLQRALDPVVLMVAGHARIGPHRHPLPTTAPLGRRAMLVCCARRHGLVASLTRTVVFGALSAEEPSDHRRLLDVEAAFLDATTPGATLGEVVTAGTAAYAASGLPAQEWHHHHQGGLTGFQPREFPATTTSTAVLEVGNAVAWNPSGGGWKVEDTCLVTEGGAAPLVRDLRWPALVVAGRPRPDVLSR